MIKFTRNFSYKFKSFLTEVIYNFIIKFKSMFTETKLPRDVSHKFDFFHKQNIKNTTVPGISVGYS